MKQKITKIHPADNVIVALTDLEAGEEVSYQGKTYKTADFVAAKHKFTIDALPKGTDIIMYGVLVGRTETDIPAGGVITTNNIKHATAGFHDGSHSFHLH